MTLWRALTLRAGAGGMQKGSRRHGRASTWNFMTARLLQSQQEMLAVT